MSPPSGRQILSLGVEITPGLAIKREQALEHPQPLNLADMDKVIIIWTLI